MENQDPKNLGDSHAVPVSDHALLQAVSDTTQVPVVDLQEMLDAARGGEDFRDFTGMTPQVLNVFENYAVALYSSGHYERAEKIFRALVYFTDGARGSAWRGLGACRQMQQDLEEAISSYAKAVLLDGKDQLSVGFCSDCLLLLGRREEAIGLLSVLLPTLSQAERDAPQGKRLQALLKHAHEQPLTPPAPRAAAKPAPTQQATRNNAPRPSEPQPASTKTSAADNKAPSNSAKADVAAEQQTDAANNSFDSTFDFSTDVDPEVTPDSDDSVGPNFDKALFESDDPEVQAFLAQPNMRARMEEIAELFRDNRVTIRELADFSQEQMDSGYAVCYQLLEQRDYPKCLEMCGWMLHIDSQDTRFYTLAGLAAHNLKLFCYAEYLYTLVGIWRPGGADAATLVYHGEAHIMQDELPEGIALVRKGLGLAQGQRGFEDIVQRGQLLLKTYGDAARSATSQPSQA